MIPLKDDNPTSTFPFVTILIIAANAAVFAYEAAIGPAAVESLFERAGAIPREIATLTDAGAAAVLPPPLTLFTSMFLHGGLFHIGGNMLYLWIFGDNIEDALGHARFALFYLATGAGAGLTHVLIHPGSAVPVVGASGAIAGVLGAYFLLYPRANVVTLVFFFIIVNVVKVPAVAFLGIWFAIQVLSTAAGGGIAWFAHIGGFVLGVLLAVALGGRRRRGARRS